MTICNNSTVHVDHVPLPPSWLSEPNALCNTQEKESLHVRTLAKRTPFFSGREPFVCAMPREGNCSRFRGERSHQTCQRHRRSQLLDRSVSSVVLRTSSRENLGRPTQRMSPQKRRPVG